MARVLDDGHASGEEPADFSAAAEVWSPPSVPVPVPQTTEYAAEPDYRTAPPTNRSKRRLALVIGCAIAVAVVGGIVAATGGHPKHVTAGPSEPPTNTPSHAPSSESAASGATPTPTSAPPTVAKLVLPASVNTYARASDSAAVRWADIVREAIASVGGGSGVQAAIYIDASQSSAFFFVGMTTAGNPRLAAELASRTPQAEADSILLGDGISTSIEFGAYGQHQATVPVIRCGQRTATDGVPLSICAGADRSTIGLIAAPRLGQGMAATTLAAIRRMAEQ